ncbi:hypothetical protein [Kineococcus terrestris]|uniref:hypothetical protein n=1 Tax=Kineococcus terrestris TaxID=2044856 RepID=UPI0034DB2D68
MAVAAVSASLGLAAVLALLLVLALGGWGSEDLCAAYLPGVELAPEGTGYGQRATFFPLGVQCFLTTPSGQPWVGGPPRSWWLSLCALAALLVSAASAIGLMVALGPRRHHC